MPSPSPSEIEVEKAMRCPVCKGPVVDEAAPASSWTIYRCQNKPYCEWWGVRAETGAPKAKGSLGPPLEEIDWTLTQRQRKKASRVSRVLPSPAPGKSLAHGRSSGSTLDGALHEKEKETTMAKDMENCDAPGCEDEKGRGIYCKRHRVRLGNINFRRRREGLSLLDKIPADDIIFTGARTGPGKDGATHAVREKKAAKPSGNRGGGYKKRVTEGLSAAPETAAPAQPAMSGNGHVLTAREIALAELDKMIEKLTSTRAIMASIPAEG